jgi:hypothetical protein
MKAIEYRETGRTDMVQGIRAESGLMWAVFTPAGEIVVGAGCCEPTAEVMDAMIAGLTTSPIGRASAAAPATKVQTISRTRRSGYGNMYRDSLRPGFDLGREMDREDSDW